jgi:uncharacterized protein
MPKEEAPALNMWNCVMNFWQQFKKSVDKNLHNDRSTMTLTFARKLGRIISAWILLVLKIYKRFISPLLPRACRFEPTCSVYMYQAIKSKGIWKGLWLGAKRLLRCNPFCEGGMDPVP